MTARIDWEGTPKLRDDVARLLTQFPDTSTFLDRLIEKFDELCTKKNCPCPCTAVCRPLLHAAADIYNAEGLTTPPAFSPSIIGTHEGARYRDHLLALHHKARTPDGTLDLMCWTLINSFLGLMEELPTLAFVDTEDATTDVPLVDVVDVPRAIEKISAPFLADGVKLFGLFTAIREQLLKNQLEASGNSKKLISPGDYDGTPREKVHAYLKHTPLEAYFESRVAFTIPLRTHFEHTHIVGASGAGKTTLIQQIILDRLAGENPPAMVIIDPKGLMATRISMLKVFDGKLKDRLVVIDPTKKPLPALGLFDLPPGQRFRNKLVEFFEYIFSTSDAQITQRQSVPFRFVIRLVLSMGGDLNTLMDVLEEKEGRFRSDIEKLGRTDDGARRFFANDFYSTGFSATRDQLRTRLYQIVSSPTLMQMYCAKESRVNFIDCLQNRKIVLINTGMNDFEKKDSQLIGRWAISMTLSAAYSRAAIDKSQWNPAYLFIDEFQEFADTQKTPELLRLAREYNLGVTIAHQNMFCDEFNDSIRGAISTNTSIKYAAAVEAQDAAYITRDLRCDADFIRSIRRTDTHANFACYVRNFTDAAIRISVPLGNIEAAPQMSSDAYADLIRHNAEALSSPARPQTPAVSPGPSASHGHPAATRQPNSAAAPAPPASDTPESGSTW